MKRQAAIRPEIVRNRMVERFSAGFRHRANRRREQLAVADSGPASSSIAGTRHDGVPPSRA